MKTAQKQIKFITLETVFNKFLNILTNQLDNCSLQKLLRLVKPVKTEESYFKTEYNKYLQSVFSFIDLGDSNKEYQIRQIFKEYFKNKKKSRKNK